MRADLPVLNEAPESSVEPSPTYAPYSHSKLDRYTVCPLQFKLKDLDKQPSLSSPALAIGVVFHQLAESYAKQCQAAGIPSNPEIMAAVIRDAIPSIPEEIAPEVNTLANQYAQTYEVSQTIHVEQALAITKNGQPCDFWAPDAWFRAKLDGLLLAKAHAVIEDYKTSAKLPTPATLTFSKQLKRYAWLLLQHYPRLETITVRLRFIRHNLILETAFDATLIQAVTREIHDLTAKIERETAWKPTPGPLCEYCGVRPSCPVYQQATRGTELPLLTPSDAAEGAQRYWALKGGLKDLEARLIDWIVQHGPIRYPAGGGVVVKSQEQRVYPNTSAVIDALQEAGVPDSAWHPLLTFPPRELEALASLHDCRNRILELGDSAVHTTLQAKPDLPALRPEDEPSSPKTIPQDAAPSAGPGGEGSPDCAGHNGLPSWQDGTPDPYATKIEQHPSDHDATPAQIEALNKLLHRYREHGFYYLPSLPDHITHRQATALLALQHHPIVFIDHLALLLDTSRLSHAVQSEAPSSPGETAALLVSPSGYADVPETMAGSCPALPARPRPSDHPIHATAPVPDKE